MKLCRFQAQRGLPKVGLLINDTTVLDLTAAGIRTMAAILEPSDPSILLDQLPRNERLPRLALNEVRLLAPVEKQEVWAAGVTYLRSKKARMDESEFSANAYDRVYEAARPELFFKSLPEKVVGPGETIGIRIDSKWSVPEPELALVLNSRGEVAGYTIGNDMSSRDIEGENLLYLPQAKTYNRSCALGPVIRMVASEEEARGWAIELEISRRGDKVFEGSTSVGNIRRSFSELSAYLFRSQLFPNGAILLTGTGIVPPDSFTLQKGDIVRIAIDGIGVLENEVCSV